MSNAKKTIKLNISIWYDEGDHSIHISGRPNFNITTVNEKDGSERCNKHLFNKLKSVLIKEGKFPLD